MYPNVGIPKESKPLEGRVALTPAAAGELVRRGVPVAIEHDAGLGSGYRDEEYRALGGIQTASAHVLVHG